MARSLDRRERALLAQAQKTGARGDFYQALIEVDLAIPWRSQMPWFTPAIRP